MTPAPTPRRHNRSSPNGPPDILTDRILPEHGLPPTGYPPNECCAWWHGDNLAGYRERGGHPVYGEHDITYQFNALGYRCPDFDVTADIRVIAIGCSYVLGTGLAQPHLFHERFAERLRCATTRSVVLWNLGWAGAGNDYIARLLLLAVPRLDPHLVLINFTHLVRRDYVSVQNRYINYNPRYVPADDITKDIFGHFAALCSPYDDQLNFFRNYKTIELTLTGRCWLYSMIRPADAGAVAAHMDQRRLVGQLKLVDRARDGGHPGPESHRIVAELYWQKLLELGGPDSIASSL
jgi:hypothetical protein